MSHVIIADPLAAEPGDLHSEDIPSGTAGKFVSNGGLSRAGRPIEKDVEPFPHTGFSETVLDFTQRLFFQQSLQSCNLPSLGLVEEELAGSNATDAHKVLVLGRFLLWNLCFGEEFLLHAVGQGGYGRVNLAVH